MLTGCRFSHLQHLSLFLPQKKKETPRHQAGATKTAGHRRGGGGGRNHQRAANGQAEDTNEARAHEEPGSERPRKTTKAQRQGNEERQGQREREGGNPSPEGAKQSRKTKRPKEKVRRTTTRPRGRPARPGHREQAHARQPTSGWTSARPEGTQPLPATNSRRPDGRVRARRVPIPCRLRTAAVRMDVCAPRGYPAPAGYDGRRPDGQVSAPQRRPAQQHNTPSGHTGEQEPGGPGHRTRKTTH